LGREYTFDYFVNKIKNRADITELNEGIGFALSEFYSNSFLTPNKNIYKRKKLSVQRINKIKELAKDILVVATPETLMRLGVEIAKEAENKRGNAVEIILQIYTKINYEIRNEILERRGRTGKRG
jgi:hypothetical protein